MTQAPRTPADGSPEFPLYRPGGHSEIQDAPASVPMPPPPPPAPQPPPPLPQPMPPQYRAPGPMAPPPMPYGQPYQPMPYAYPVPAKSPAAAGVLAFFFGPLGMFYSTGTGAVVMLAVNIVVAVATVGIGLLVTWPICVIWAVQAANQHNRTARTYGGY